MRDVSVSSVEVLDELETWEIYDYLIDRDFDFNVKQRVIDIVFDNDKKTALQELESLFGGMYTGWEKV